MDEDKLYEQYLYEVSSFDKYGSKNVITFDEWKLVKPTMENTQPVDESQLKLHRESLGHLPGDEETPIPRQTDPVDWDMMKNVFDKSLTPELAKLKNESI
jgi:hypothetical protein